MQSPLSDITAPSQPLRGFSLVELSIVLVILGLLVGGVLSGKSLIRAAELRSITTQYQEYFTATQSFRQKYFALPADMTNATAFWGAAHATPATCETTPSTTTATCNGNGSGIIDPGEMLRFWQHLANAKMIAGSYCGADNCEIVAPGTKVSPYGRISRSAWTANYVGPVDSAYATNSFGGEYGHVFYFWLISYVSGGPGGALKPGEVWNIDVKSDDGKPGTGKIVIIGSQYCDSTGDSCLETCTTTNDPANLTADYLLSSSATECSLAFRQQF